MLRWQCNVFEFIWTSNIHLTVWLQAELDSSHTAGNWVDNVYHSNEIQMLQCDTLTVDAVFYPSL